MTLCCRSSYSLEEEDMSRDLCCRSSYSLEEDKFHVTRYLDEEPARVDSVKLMGDASGSEILQRIMVVLRVEVRTALASHLTDRAEGEALLSVVGCLEHISLAGEEAWEVYCSVCLTQFHPSIPCANT